MQQTFTQSNVDQGLQSYMAFLGPNELKEVLKSSSCLPRVFWQNTNGYVANFQLTAW